MQLFVDNLTNVDFSYLDPARGVVGETWLASALLDGGLDDSSMIWDFGIVKKVLRNWLDDEVDHRLLLPVKSPNLEYEIRDNRVYMSWKFADSETLRMEAPEEAVALIDAETITAESVASWSITKLTEFFPENLDQLKLSFVPESINGAFYHYSHGLKKHDGNCQRIAHGHRSRIEIEKDGQRDSVIESAWAKQWADIYLGSTEDMTDHSDNSSADASDYHFAYDAPQGHFRLSLPKRVCYLMDSDTTVECIAKHIAEALHQQHPEHTIRVKAFEGLNKGAFFSAG